MKIKYLAVLLFTLATVSTFAYSTEETVPPPPALPETEPGETTELNTPPPEGLPEPEVTIVKRGEDRVEEYRMGGRLYMIKVTPPVGPSYYLVDTDGDGNLDTRRDSLEPNLVIPMWVLFQW
ncbi:conserved exported hypothetical protein [Gammaproteobacteria bacterium]